MFMMVDLKSKEWPKGLAFVLWEKLLRKFKPYDQVAKVEQTAKVLSLKVLNCMKSKSVCISLFNLSVYLGISNLGGFHLGVESCFIWDLEWVSVEGVTQASWSGHASCMSDCW
mgnify:CR=1 FL=1